MENEKRKKRKFSDEFKAEAVRMSDERTLSEVARNLDISLSLLTKWRAKAKGSKPVVEPLAEDLVEKCRKLECVFRYECPPDSGNHCPAGSGNWCPVFN